MQPSAPSKHTGEQEPSGPGHCTSNTTHRAGTPENRSQEAQDTTNGPRRTDHAHTTVNKRQGALDTAHTCARRAAEDPETPNH